ncbi:MAG: DUF6064 family protein [Vicinamibacterales bacterium]
MTMPFTPDQFFDLFAAYNRDLWPAILLLWLASVSVAWTFLRGRAARSLVLWLLAAHWLWAGLVYHLSFFTRINPAAWVFGAAFVLEALLLGRLAWQDSKRGIPVLPTFAIDGRHPVRFAVSAAFVIYGLAYPAIALASGHPYPQTPTFGVPCPTTMLTAGLFVGVGAVPRYLLVVPVLWSGIGGSAAWLIGVRADLVLPVAGVAMIVSLATPRSHATSRLRPGHATR